MTPGTDVALAGVSQADLDALRAAQDSEMDDNLFQTPILKIGQPLTKEVSGGDAEAGQFINTLTGEAFDGPIEAIVAFYQKGRFASDREDGRAYVAFGQTIPESWEKLVGEAFVGTPFTEHPDAEEKYAYRVNVAKEIEWGKGPLISTTHNFTCLIVNGEDLDPVRLSLQRTNMPTVRKWLTLMKSKRRAQVWDYAYDLSTFRKSFTKGVAHLLEVKMGRATENPEREAAVELAQAVAQGLTVDNQTGDLDAPVAPPAAEGALAI